MICTFFGHRDAPSSVKRRLTKTINLLIDEGVDEFYVGNNGNFDFWVQDVLVKIKRERDDISVTVVLSHLGEQAISADQIFTIFPEGLEKAPPRFAISKRNDWLLSKSEIVVVYVKNNLSNAHKWLEKADRKGLRIINLATVLP